MSCNRLCSASCVSVDGSVELSGSGAADRAASAMARWPRMLQKRSSCVLFGSLSRRPCLTRRSSDACGCAGMAPTAACARVTLSVCKVQPLLTHIQQLHDAEGRDERGLNSPCLMRRGHRLQRLAALRLKAALLRALATRQGLQIAPQRHGPGTPAASTQGQRRLMRRLLAASPPSQRGQGRPSVPLPAAEPHQATALPGLHQPCKHTDSNDDPVMQSLHREHCVPFCTAHRAS